MRGPQRTTGVAGFTVIGENIHCSRVVARDGARGGIGPDGRPGLRFPAPEGGEAWLPLPPSIVESSEFEGSGRIKHVMAAVRQGLAGGPEADVAEQYVAWMARRQVKAGAHYLDLNVDEISPHVDDRLAAMRWLVGAVGPASGVPLSIDSSDAAVLEAGLQAIDPTWAAGAAPLLNSASTERPEVLALAASRGSPVVLSCTGDSMPSGTQDRIERAMEVIALARSAGLPMGSLFVDPLVIPIGVDPDAGRAYLDAVRTIRERYGDELHITSGISNVSFGLPARRLLGDVFLDLCVEAGQDSGIVDPLSNLAAALAPDRESEPYRLAFAMLTGEDAYGVEFIAAFRAGRLDPVAAAMGDGATRTTSPS
jgi:5-methyltetrahydrofolate--homocysteine methyltransferase